MTAYDLKDHSRTVGRTSEKKTKWMTAWIAHRLELKLSPAWQEAPITLRKMLDRLEIEHLRHGGQNNGELFVSYGQFVESGVSKRTIKQTQELGVALGLMSVAPANDSGGNIRPPNAYRLTYVPARGRTSPTDEWKRITPERAALLVRQYRDATRVSKVEAVQERAA